MQYSLYPSIFVLEVYVKRQSVNKVFCLQNDAQQEAGTIFNVWVCSITGKNLSIIKSWESNFLYKIKELLLLLLMKFVWSNVRSHLFVIIQISISFFSPLLT